jgi:hypothetical protein
MQFCIDLFYLTTCTINNTFQHFFSAADRILMRSRQLVDVKKDDGFAALHLASLNGHVQVNSYLRSRFSFNYLLNFVCFFRLFCFVLFVCIYIYIYIRWGNYCWISASAVLIL